MKSYLFILLCCFSTGLFAQNIPDAMASANITIENVTFKSAGVMLEGAIFKPKHAFAALVLVHGSGQEIRMEKMASLLAKKGIAVLTYDKRGVGKSGGVYAGPEVGSNNIDPANLNLLASDASAANDLLLTHLTAKNLPVGLMGFSQAGWIIPLAAKKNRHINFMVFFSGPVVNTLEQLRFQFYTDGKRNFWETHTEAEAREHVSKDPDRYQFVATDPRDALATLQRKGLWLFGGRDIQIPVGLSIEHLNVLKAQGKPYEYRLFQPLGHNTVTDEAIQFAVQWIKSLRGHKKKNH